jgi:hypothetical protein
MRELLREWSTHIFAFVAGNATMWIVTILAGSGNKLMLLVPIVLFIVSIGQIVLVHPFGEGEIR